MNKTVMVFGGGPNQLTLVRAVKALNFNTVVVDPNPDAPARTMADSFLVIDPQDYETTRKAALDHSVDGIVTSQMENPLPIMAKLAKELNFIFPSPETIARCRDKSLMKNQLRISGIPCAKGIVIKGMQPVLPDDLSQISPPYIMKPLDSHSSRGVLKAACHSEVINYSTAVRRFSKDGSFLIEEYIAGREFSVESLVFKGRVYLIQITEKFLTPAPYRVEIGHLQPALITDAEKLKIHRIINQTINAFELDNCSTHIELKLSDSGPIIIEIAARSGGDYISSFLTRCSTGINMDEALVKISLGIRPDLTSTRRSHSYIKYLELSPGSKVVKISPWRSLLKERNLVQAEILINEGQTIPEITDSSKRPGFVLVQGNSRDEVIELAEEYTDRLKDCIVLTH